MKPDTERLTCLRYQHVLHGGGHDPILAMQAQWVLVSHEFFVNLWNLVKFTGVPGQVS